MLRVTLLAPILLTLGPTGQAPLTLDVRVFRGVEDVTASSRVTVYRAGERERPIVQLVPGQPHTVRLPPGIYDAQAIEERDGRVVNIRWAERLVVMPYPDEKGHHLEVINFETGYGALQVHTSDVAARIDDIAVFPVNQRAQPAARTTGPRAVFLFVVRAGQYDLQIRRGAHAAWYPDIDVPPDRTRFWVVP
jgi:hypothetical protein